MKSIDDELGQSLHKLEKKLKRQRIENKKRKVVELVPDKEFSEIIEKIILPIMIQYKKFLETRQENVYLNCAIEKPYQLHEGITFELKGSIKISSLRSFRHPHPKQSYLQNLFTMKQSPPIGHRAERISTCMRSISEE